MPKNVDVVNQPDAAAADAVLEALHGAMHAIRAQQHRVLRDSGQPLTRLEGRVLGFFARHPGATQSELVAHAGHDKGQLARLVSGLRERNLLQARADEADRRIQRLHLTVQGTQVTQALRRQGRKVAATALHGFGEGERAQLLALLLRLRANLEAAAE